MAYGTGHHVCPGYCPGPSPPTSCQELTRGERPSGPRAHEKARTRLSIEEVASWSEPAGPYLVGASLTLLPDHPRVDERSDVVVLKAKLFAQQLVGVLARPGQAHLGA